MPHLDSFISFYIAGIPSNFLRLEWSCYYPIAPPDSNHIRWFQFRWTARIIFRFIFFHFRNWLRTFLQSPVQSNGADYRIADSTIPFAISLWISVAGVASTLVIAWVPFPLLMILYRINEMIRQELFSRWIYLFPHFSVCHSPSVWSVDSTDSTLNQPSMPPSS